LRYGVGDVTGVIFNSPEHEPIARGFALWLRTLTDRDISLVRTTPGALARCECEAVPPPAAATALPPSWLPVLGDTVLIASGSGFCTQHWCDKEDRGPCCPVDVVEPEIHPSLYQQPKYHPMFLHIPKTGGSSIECLSKDWDAVGQWTNMGHASFPAVSHCGSRADPIVPHAFIMTVRNPFDYWISVYEYAKLCIAINSSGSLEAGYLRKRNATDSLATFSTFMRYMVSQKNGPSQAGHIRRSCGMPCNYRYLLRTETLDKDWLAVLGTLHLPLRPLSHVNVANPNADSEMRKAMFTPELVRIVQQLEPDLFVEYGYSRSP
jgi:hypothetical protein